MSDDSLTSWLKSGRYLPRFMRDFHDQKSLFKAMHETADIDGHEYARKVDWVTGQCYVIDIFLWFMARRGYTLQPARADQAFLDIHETIRVQNERRHAAETAALKSMFDKGPK
ncbi:hypothetical protein ACXIVK_24210 [Paraburkholderia caledonica]